jgi:hypothetical protein
MKPMSTTATHDSGDGLNSGTLESNVRRCLHYWLFERVV